MMRCWWHFSTDYVFDGTRREPLTTSDPLGPLSAYGKSKLLGEQLLQQNGPSNWLILRTAWLYGPGGPVFPRNNGQSRQAGQATQYRARSDWHAYVYV